MNTATGPVIELSPSGGFRVTLNGITGEGPTIAEALAQYQAATAQTYDTEKGDESLATQTAARQTDILANDRAIIGNQIQSNVVLALGLGLI
ncbi:MAG: hypothetical protein JF615_05380 [Asticcacaulis sp.]|nr:hypothetical protein [Asticcacaulis sp.]